MSKLTCCSVNPVVLSHSLFCSFEGYLSLALSNHACKITKEKADEKREEDRQDRKASKATSPPRPFHRDLPLDQKPQTCLKRREVKLTSRVLVAAGGSFFLPPPEVDPARSTVEEDRARATELEGPADAVEGPASGSMDCQIDGLEFPRRARASGRGKEEG